MRPVLLSTEHEVCLEHAYKDKSECNTDDNSQRKRVISLPQDIVRDVVFVQFY